MQCARQTGVAAPRHTMMLASSRRRLCDPSSSSLFFAFRARTFKTRASNHPSSTAGTIQTLRCYSTIPFSSPSSPSSSSSLLLLLQRRNQHSYRHFQGFSFSSSFSTSAARATTDPPPPPEHLNEAELKIYQKLAAALLPSHLNVQDISDGCGSMYALEVISTRFDGMNQVKAHRLVSDVLKEEVKGWHGVRIKTGVPMPPDPDPPIGS